jgi:beta-glucanase (GH16 family)
MSLMSNIRRSVRLTSIIFCLTSLQIIHAQIPTDFNSNPAFDEEFNGTQLDTTKWQYRGLGTRNNCVNTQSAVAVANGYLTITTYSDSSSGVLTNYCGMIGTQSPFLQTYGYWEASIRFHYNQGFQCAFWNQSPTTGSTIGKPQQSGVEQDIFEHTSSNTSSKGYDHALHWDGYSTYHQSVGYFGSLSTLDDGNFHTFAVAWRPSGYTFYVDGQITYQLTPAQAAVSNVSQYIILSTEVPSSYPSGGYGPLGTSTATFDVDYVRVYPYSPAVSIWTLAPTADSYVRDGSYAGTNFGSANVLIVKSDATGYNRQSYLRFDLSQVTGKVQQATLYLTPTGVGQTNVLDRLGVANNDTWTESGLTWNNQPGYSSILSTGKVYDANIVNDLDATAGTIAGTPVSLELLPNGVTGSNAWVNFASREAITQSQIPSLVVLTTPN